MQNCRNCLIIRYFLIAVLFIVLMGLVFTDKTHYLSFIKPYYAAYLVFFFGLAVFFLKLTQYFFKKKLSISNQSDEIRDTTRKPTKSMTSKKVN